MKQAVVIVNPHSGKGKNKETIDETSSKYLSLFIRLLIQNMQVILLKICQRK